MRHSSDICQTVRYVRQLDELDAQQVHVKRNLESQELKLEDVLRIDTEVEGEEFSHKQAGGWSFDSSCSSSSSKWEVSHHSSSVTVVIFV